MAPEVCELFKGMNVLAISLLTPKLIEDIPVTSQAHPQIGYHNLILIATARVASMVHYHNKLRFSHKYFHRKFDREELKKKF